MAIEQKQIMRWSRRVTAVLAIAGAAYLVSRYEVFRMDSDAPSPLHRFADGSTLVLDRRPRTPEPGDAVVVRTASGVLHVTGIEAVREDGSGIWCEIDDPSVAGLTSSTAGWIDGRAIYGRVLFGWKP